MEWPVFRSLSFSHQNGCFVLDVSLQASRIPSNNSIGRYVSCDNTSSADVRVFSDGHVGKNRAARPNRSTSPDYGPFHLPFLFSLQLPVRRRCARIGIANESDAVTDKYIVFNRHAFTNTRMA